MDSLKNESDTPDSQKLVEDFARDSTKQSFSPYLKNNSRGVTMDLEEGKIMLFACRCPNLDNWVGKACFRRVFPSFISLLEKGTPVLPFFFFEANHSVLLHIHLKVQFLISYIQCLSIWMMRSHLRLLELVLSLLTLEDYEVVPDILIAGDAERQKDGFFKFEHEWMDGDNPDLELDQRLN